MSKIGKLTRALKWKTISSQSNRDAKNILADEGKQEDIKFFDEYAKGAEKEVGALVIKYVSISRSPKKEDKELKTKIKKRLSQPFVKDKKEKEQK